MADPATEALVERARAVLDRNRCGDSTCPSLRLYPHQWLWDSCFTAVGLARYDPPRAAVELQSLCRGQWANGMVPHMIFASGTRDLGSRTIWQSRRYADAPRDVETSCITQPPLLAVATHEVARALAGDDRRAFLDDLVPRIVTYHEWLYRERDPGGTGLVTLIHPWECGLDSTPPWMRALRAWRMPAWLGLGERLHLARLLRALRYDTRYLPAAERATDDDGLRMLALAVRAKRYRFELRRMPPDRCVLIEDVGFNAMLAAANDALRELADASRTTIPERLSESMRLTPGALEGLFDEADGEYHSRDAGSGAPLPERTVVTFLPLWGGAPSRERVARLTAALREPRRYGPAFAVPSVPLDAAEFQESRYWKGPTWVNTNWMIVRGLHRQGEHELADALRRSTITMVDTAGCAEYFSALTGAALGADEFSWTAALTIDLALDDGPPASPV